MCQKVDILDLVSSGHNVQVLKSPINESLHTVTATLPTVQFAQLLLVHDGRPHAAGLRRLAHRPLCQVGVQHINSFTSHEVLFVIVHY
jgi:hypothetical protein